MDGEPAQVAGKPSFDRYIVSCPACGAFEISGTAAEDASLDEEGRRFLSHQLRWQNELGDKRPIVMTATLMEAKRRSLPTISEQIDNLLSFLALRLRHLGRELDQVRPELISALGSVDRRGAVGLILQLVETGLVVGTNVSSHLSWNVIGVGLTLQGWLRAGELRKGKVSERFAFMAMQYGDDELEALVKDVFRPAVRETGYDLEVLRDRPQAGLIDNYLRSRIRLARFLIADLSHANNGAYWEAGFAEGLGKPVIYTCSQAIFEEKKTHFDANHSQTIVWSKSRVQDARDQLIACVRNSIAEAA